MDRLSPADYLNVYTDWFWNRSGNPSGYWPISQHWIRKRTCNDGEGKRLPWLPMFRLKPICNLYSCRDMAQHKKYGKLRLKVFFRLRPAAPPLRHSASLQAQCGWLRILVPVYRGKIEFLTFTQKFPVWADLRKIETLSHFCHTLKEKGILLCVKSNANAKSRNMFIS